MAEYKNRPYQHYTISAMAFRVILGQHIGIYKFQLAKHMQQRAHGRYRFALAKHM
jgi:hypothetical protein